MKANGSNAEKDVSSIGMLKQYVNELPIKNLDGQWIREQKIDLDALMMDSSPGAGRNTLPAKAIR